MDITELRDKELDPRLAHVIAPFLIAYRPHDPIPDRSELTRIDKESLCGMRALARDIGREY